MRRIPVTPTWAALLLATASLLAPRGAAALQDGAVVGVVHDESGGGVASVEVTLIGAARRTVTDVHGAFVFRQVPAGADTLRFRRLGFRPSVVPTLVSAVFGEPVDVALTALPIRLAAVAVRAARPHYTGHMADFYRRRDAGGSGRFFTRAQIDSLQPSRTNDLLRRVAGMRFSPPGGQTVVFGRERCAPLVWVDGMPAASAYFDPDNVNVNDIEGLEVYTGMANVPTALVGPRGAGLCGAIGIWTRDGELPRNKKKRADENEAARELAAMVDSLQVYTAEQVDVAATLDPAHPFAPAYPRELRDSKATALVVAEFVVDARGRAEPATFSVVSSSGTLFTAAVDSALPTALFRPATLNGRPVRQAVQLPVYFLPKGAAPQQTTPQETMPQEGTPKAGAPRAGAGNERAAPPAPGADGDVNGTGWSHDWSDE